MQERSSAAQIILKLSFSQTAQLIINDLKNVRSKLQENTFVNLAWKSTLNSARRIATALNSDTHLWTFSLAVVQSRQMGGDS